MSSQPYHSIHFDWLAVNDTANTIVSPDDEGLERGTYPLPDNLGTSSIETLNLAMGMSIFKAINQLSPEAIGQSIPTAEIDVKLKGPTFQAQIIRGGRVMERQFHPDADLVLSPGIDLFRYSDGYRISPKLDGSSSSEMTCLSIMRQPLDELLGEREAEQMLSHLGLLPMPKVLAAAIPMHISAHLHSSVSNVLTGAARNLYCQARALDYLIALMEKARVAKKTRLKTSRSRSQAVHDFLVATQGRLPTLNELAVRFGCSARVLNDEFTAAYSMSIYSFISNQRLIEAHAAILNTDVALKVLAFRLGYSHVNHFITAFRKKFGYPPGSIRKGR